MGYKFKVQNRKNVWFDNFLYKSLNITTKPIVCKIDPQEVLDIHVLRDQYP